MVLFIQNHRRFGRKMGKMVSREQLENKWMIFWDLFRHLSERNGGLQNWTRILLHYCSLYVRSSRIPLKGSGYFKCNGGECGIKIRASIRKSWTETTVCCSQTGDSKKQHTGINLHAEILCTDVAIPELFVCENTFLTI